ncbi:MAG: DUF4212 domain-containing protein [Bacteroidetes bacterium]|nr:DUF4212 domain-containing protein [Bacteroidota bacterium]
MESKTQDYHISFFKPANPQTKANRNMIILFVSVWAVAIFGFQILLKVIQKPSPEVAYQKYDLIWDNINSNTADYTEIQQFAQISLQVLSKVFISADERKALDIALTSSLYKLLNNDDKIVFIQKISKFEKLKIEIDNISDADYISSRNELAVYVSPIIGLGLNDVRMTILPLELLSAEVSGFNENIKVQIPGIMEKYLIHNESALTRASFLGFPFHYFYTAVFLLVLFVILCLLYCVKTEALNKKFGIND